jgi:hypothetical protein
LLSRFKILGKTNRVTELLQLAFIDLLGSKCSSIAAKYLVETERAKDETQKATDEQLLEKYSKYDPILNFLIQGCNSRKLVHCLIMKSSIVNATITCYMKCI